MKRYFPLLLLIILFPITRVKCDFVKQEVDWFHLYGGSFSESGVSITKSSDGGYFIVGSSNDRDPWWDIYVIKTDELGNEIWNNTYGNLRESEQAYDHVLAENDGLVIIGIKDRDNATKKNILVVKISKDGDLLWNQTYGSERIEEGRSIIISSEGGFILTGSQSGTGPTETDIIVMKIDDNGNLLWNSTIEQIGHEIGASIIESSNGGYIITGSISRPELESDLYLVKINNTGSVLWNRTFGDSGYNITYRLYPQDQGKFVGEDDEGNIIVMGQTQSFGASDLDILVLKLDSEGYLIWKKLLGGEDQDGIGNGVIIKDGFIVVGSTNSFGAGINDDVLIYKLYANGSINWMMTFGAEGIDRGFDV
ncbi:hypothetical protein GH157_01960, partial [archaeon]|nr:hypothetical protein [archaeon]